jgi:uncharacterized alpha-E superfamily protein
VLREEIGSETLSYIQLAIYAMNKAKISSAPLLELQNVEDNILAFWGISDDYISNDITRNILKSGRRIERIDLYARLKVDVDSLKHELEKLASRLEKSGLDYDANQYRRLDRLIYTEDSADYAAIVQAIDNLIGE